MHVILEYFHPSLTASLLKGLKHANIVTLHDIIHVPGNLTFVFEYVVSIVPIYLLYMDDTISGIIIFL